MKFNHTKNLYCIFLAQLEYNYNMYHIKDKPTLQYVPHRLLFPNKTSSISYAYLALPTRIKISAVNDTFVN